MFRTFFAALVCVCFGLSASVAGGAVVDRSEFTTTSEVAPGKLRTQVSSQPLNFETDQGWQPIDTELERGNGGVARPVSVDGDVAIPPSLGAALELEHDGREVSFRLKGASGEIDVDDATAAFDEAMPGVDVSYRAVPRGVKETLTLASSKAPSVFAYDVRGGASWSAAVDGRGEVVLRDGSGAERYRIAAPLAWDSAEDPAYTNALALSVSRVSPGRWTVTLRPDRSWLGDPQRVWPVTIDPDFSWSEGATHFHGATDCYLASGAQANTTFCAQSYLQTGHYNRSYAALLQFPVAAAIPSNAVVSSASFRAYAPPATPKALASHSLKTLTSEWDSSATWNKRKPNVPWTTTLGGDVSSNPAHTSAATNVQAHTAWYQWSAPLATVQGWVAGSLPNYGFQLTTNAGAPLGNAYVWASTEASLSSQFPADSTKWPTLDVTWTVPDTTAPALTLSGELSTGQTQWRTAESGDITLAGTDAGTGVKRVEVLDGAAVIASDTQACPAGACAMSRTFTLDLEALGEGVHTLTAAVVDGGNLRTEQTFAVRVDRVNPTLALTGTLVDLESQPASTGTRGVHVEATDAGAGIVGLQLKVDGIEREQVSQACVTGGCSRTEDWTVDVGALSDGPHTVEITATDGAGHTKTTELAIVTEQYPMPQAPPLSDTSVTPFPDQVDFLYDGPEAVQTGLNPAILDERRTAVVTGKVFNGEGDPAAGVTVSVIDHPEFGETVSRENGQYFLVVNGGAQLRLRYEVQGALPAERRVETKWTDYTWADDVWLVTQDPIGTPVTFGSSTTQLQVAESSPVEDEDGERQTRVLVHPGTQAWKEMADGSMIPLTGGTMRMTEYTVGGEEGAKRMPATLPDQSAYTWAAEFQIDQAQGDGVEHVRFSKPVIAYVENFLDFPVGLDIPIGTYEPSKGAWAGEPDGRVIEIVGESAGKAVVDVTGFGAANADELDYFNFTEAELEELANSYDPGDTLWRARMTRYSSADFNHAFWFPPEQLGDFGDGPAGDPDGSCEQPGSIISCQVQSLGEVADLGGTPYSLRYDSTRTPGAVGSRSFRVQLTDEAPLEDLDEVRVVAVIAGQRLIHSVKAPPFQELAANLSHTFRWDGNDAFGRPMVGGAEADIDVRNLFPSEYSAVSRIGRPRVAQPQMIAIEMPFFGRGSAVSWGRGGGGSSMLASVSMPPAPAGPATVDRPSLECNSSETECWSQVPTARELGESRNRTPVSRAYTVAVPYLDGRSMGVGGWGVSAQHRYDTGTGTLYTGDGQRRSADSLPNRVTTVRKGYVPGEDPELSSPTFSMDVLPDGSVVRALPYIGRIVVDHPQGGTSALAGDPDAPWGTGDGGPAIGAGLRWPMNVAAGPDGSVYIGDLEDRRVRKVAPDGTITTAVGNGTATDGADSANPLQHAIFPRDLAVAGDGTLYIVGASGIHVLDPSGRMSVLADVSGCGPYSDHCRYWTPKAQLVTAGADGTVYWTGIVNDYTHYLFRYKPGEGSGPEQLMATYAFEASREGPIAESQLTPTDIEVDDSGRLLIAEHNGAARGIWRLGDKDRVRKIGLKCRGRNDWPDNIYAGEGGPLSAACGDPAQLAQGPDGLYMLEGMLGQIRRVSNALQRYPVDETLIPSEDGAEVYRFDKEGRHLATLDGRTERTIRTFTYDGQGRLGAVVEADLGSTTFAYGSGSVTVTGPDGQATVIATNAAGYATSITDADGASQRYEYTADGLMTSYEDQLEKTTEFTWGPTGRLLTDTTPRGGAQTLSRNEAGTTTAVNHTTAGGQTTTYTDERVLQPVSADPGDEGATVRRDVRTVTAPSGAQTTHTETAEDGSASTLTQADGTRVTQTRENDPRWGTEVATFGGTTTLPSGLQTSGAHATTVERGNGQDPQDPFDYESIIDSYTVDGRATTSTYDKGERTDTVLSPVGRESQVEYDEDDQPVRLSAAGRDDTTITWDARGRPTALAQGDAVEAMTYGPGGRLAQIVDAEDRATTISRDTVGRPTSVTTPGGQITGFAYDDAGWLTSTTAPDGRAFLFEYDDNGNQTQMTRPARAGSGGQALASTLEYDVQDRVTKLIGASGDEVTASYDSAGRLAEYEAGDGTSASTTYEPVQDGVGARLASVQTNEGASAEFDYDGPLLTGVTALGDTVTGDAMAAAPAVGLAYDSSLRLTSEEIDGDSVGYQYDNDDQATQIGDVALSYDAASGDPQTISAGDTATTVDVDTRGDLHALSSTAEAVGVSAPVLSESVVRDKLGRITQRSETVGAGPADVYGYQYNLAGQLTEVSLNGATAETYGYDATGGMTSRGTGAISTWIATDGHGRPTQTADGTALTWSPDGELLTLTAPGGAQTSFAYDGFGRLVEVTLPGGQVGRYRYDAMGRRTAVRLGGAMVRRFVYGAAEFPRARIDAAGDVLERYIYASYDHVPDLIVRRDGQRVRLITDTLGSVRAAVDADSGQVLQRLSYDAYGRVTQDTAPGTQPFGFKGSLSDPVAQGAGLVWMGVRAYLPSMARFTTPDPAGLEAVWNQHDALGGDPINLVDADGRLPIVLAIPAALAVRAVAMAAARAVAGAVARAAASRIGKAAGGLAGEFAVMAALGQMQCMTGAGAAAGSGPGGGGGHDPFAKHRRPRGPLTEGIGDPAQSLSDAGSTSQKSKHADGSTPGTKTPPPPPTRAGRIIALIRVIVELGKL